MLIFSHMVPINWIFNLISFSGKEPFLGTEITYNQIMLSIENMYDLPPLQ